MKFVHPSGVSGAGLGFLALLVVALGFVSAEADDFQRFSWRGEIAGSRVLRVQNPFGDVRLRYGGDAGQVEVAAVMQQLRSDGVYLVTRTEEHDGVLVVSVDWASKPGLPLSLRPEGDLSRAGLAVLVPRAVTTIVDAPNGLVETRGIHGDVELHTESGDTGQWALVVP